MAEALEQQVRSEIADGVGRVTLERPQAMNAITVALASELERAVRDTAARARVIVISGAGGNFSAGGDVDEVRRLRAEGPESLRELFVRFHAACAAIAEVPVPVIAAVEGVAVAGGFELALACDVVLVSEDARLADIHLAHGMIPGGGSTQRLPRLVGAQRALALILSGETITAGQAVEWGLAYRALPAEIFAEQVSTFAARLARHSPAALARAKRLVRDGLERPLREGLAAEIDGVVDHLMEVV